VWWFLQTGLIEVLLHEQEEEVCLAPMARTELVVAIVSETLISATGYLSLRNVFVACVVELATMERENELSKEQGL